MGRSSGNYAQSKDEEHSDTQYPHESSLNCLRQHLSYYNTGSSGYRASIVLEKVHSLENSYRNSPRKKLESKTFLLFVDLLAIEDAALCPYTGRLIEFLLEEKLIRISKSAALACITKLCTHQHRCQSSCGIEKPLSLLVLAEASNMPAEMMAQRIVSPFLLPTLQSPSATTSLFCTTCQTISGILHHPNHASAILGPLIVDVTPDGEESIVNPLRIRIFSALTLRITSVVIDEQRITSCYTLANAINESIKVDGSSTSGNTADLDISSLRGFFLEAIQCPDGSLFPPSLVLLRSIIRKDGSGSTATIRSQKLLDLLCSLLFEPTRSNTLRNERCSFCLKRGDELGQFLSIIHMGQTESRGLDKDTILLATECLADMVQALPWIIWLQRGKSNSQLAVSGFRRKLIDFLLGFAEFTGCALKRCDEGSVLPICNVLRSFFLATRVEDDSLLTSLSINVWSTLAESFLATSSTKIRGELLNVLTDSTGGRVTPNGDTLPMYPPACSWLLSNDAMPFLNDLFEATRCASDVSQHALKLLSSISRTCPQIAYTDDLSRFRALLSVGKVASFELKHLVILDAFLFGRKSLGASSEFGEVTVEVAAIASNILDKSLREGNNQFQCLGLSIFGSLLSRDWEYLDKDDDQLPKHFEAVLDLCESKNTKVRSAACKSIGDFCTHYIPLATRRSRGEGKRVSAIAKCVCSRLLVALSDQNVPVRSMTFPFGEQAMFSLGNLAYSLSADKYFSLDVPLVIDTCKKHLIVMQDSNVKLVGNSVRSAGHWGHLLAHAEQRMMTQEGIEILGNIVDGLSLKLSNTLESLSGEKKATLTWKERSAAKKHGWGACHSLGCIFKSLSGLDDPFFAACCSQAVSQLILCIEKFYSLNEKIALSAIGALCEVNTQNLAELSAKSGMLGEAIATCIGRLYRSEADTGDRKMSEKAAFGSIDP
eukprot:scaffold25694_cov127-Cylindrotheca_fusiformis.AAC.7